jgi:hypothetical protein
MTQSSKIVEDFDSESTNIMVLLIGLQCYGRLAGRILPVVCNGAIMATLTSQPRILSRCIERCEQDKGRYSQLSYHYIFSNLCLHRLGRCDEKSKIMVASCS